MSEGPAKYLGVGLQLAITILVGFFAGYLVDKKFGVLPWCSLAGVFLGLAVGFYQLIVELQNGKNGLEK